jgi:hypothetical protein
LFGLFVGTISFIVFYMNSQTNSFVRDSEVSDSARTITWAIDQVYAMGPGTIKIIQLKIPPQVEQAYASNRQVIYRIRGEGSNLSDIHFIARPTIYGFLHPSIGLNYIVLKAENNGMVSISQLNAPNITNRMIGYYNFDLKNSSHIFEITGSFPDASINGDVDCTVEGYVGKGCYFDGTGDYLSIDDVDFDDDFSVSLWFKAEEFSSYGSFAAKSYEGDGDRSWHLGLNSDGNKIRFYISEDGSYESELDCTGISTLSEGQWQHVTAIWNKAGRTTTLYLNGVVDCTNTAAAGTIHQTDEPIIIGAYCRNDFTCSGYFNGVLDEVLIFNRTLNFNEVDSIYSAGRKR